MLTNYLIWLFASWTLLLVLARVFGGDSSFREAFSLYFLIAVVCVLVDLAAVFFLQGWSPMYRGLIAIFAVAGTVAVWCTGVTLENVRVLTRLW